MKNLFSYEGKRCLFVGCATGMGAAAAKAVQLLGGEAHGVDYREPDYKLASFTSCDLRDESQVDSMLGSLEAPFHAVFYCAGLPPTYSALDNVKVNISALRKVAEGVHPLVPRGGAMAFIASMGGMQFMDNLDVLNDFLSTDGSFAAAEAWCEAHADNVNEGYGFSKQAAILYTINRALAVVGDGVRVNCISPGSTDTPMMPEFEKFAPPEMIKAFYGPLDRAAQPEEMGWPLVFLNSDAATFITGLNLIIDGGFAAGMATGLIDLNEILSGLAEAT
ncbi:MAG: SDR family oxidoreductase [Acidimicrobiia bacterium]|nr:SDR family oxidoreductase [Acidimicrobiia bacterium]MBV9040146.1 SDR family oxidoreductase [Acidimicrobiia bacterium]